MTRCRSLTLQHQHPCLPAAAKVNCFFRPARLCLFLIPTLVFIIFSSQRVHLATSGSYRLPQVLSLLGFRHQTPSAVTPLAATQSTKLSFSTIMATPPPGFRTPPQAAPSFKGTPQSIIEDTKRIIEQSRSVYDGIVSAVDPTKEGAATFGSVLKPQIDHENEAGLQDRILGFYQYVSADEKLRNASTESDKLMSDFYIESSMREDLFSRVKAAWGNKEDVNKLDKESKKYLEEDYKGYIRNGLDLPPGEKRDRFKEIKKRLNTLQIEFSVNLNEDKSGQWFTTEELAGVPQDLVSSLKVGTQDDGPDNVGKHFLTYKYPDFFPTMKYATNPETRRKVYVGYENRVPANIGIFKEAIVLRDEAARLLGYPNHAAYRLENKMAKTPTNVREFLDDLHQRLKKGGAAELEKLKALKANYLKENGRESEIDGHFYLWDNSFYDQIMINRDYSVDHEKIAEYFSLDRTIKGMLGIFEHLLGLRFFQLKTPEDRAAAQGLEQEDHIVWHEDVQVFSVWDTESDGSDAGFAGYLYLDLYPREGKYGHAANFNIQPGYVGRNAGERRYPATALVCNFSKPTAKKPSLLKHDEVVTLFHELGHGIHDLVSRTLYSRFHGTNVAGDFVEAPSQMLENWCWNPAQLRSLSYHYSHLSPEYEATWKEAQNDANIEKPGAQLQDDLSNKLVATKHVNGALANLRQLHFGIFDMTLHEVASHDAVEELNPSVAFNKLRRDIVGMDDPVVFDNSTDEWGHRPATFGHLMGGYDAGYYGYLYSLVYSTDMFVTAFEKDPMDANVGKRYRHTILERGGSLDERDILKAFLGREPSTEAFYKELGI